MSQTVITEGSALFLKFTFKDETNVPIVPSTIEWRVDNVTNPHSPVEVLTWANVPVPASSVDVQIAGTDNGITDQDKVFELREVTVRVDNTLSTQATQHKRYRVKNLEGIT